LPVRVTLIGRTARSKSPSRLDSCSALPRSRDFVTAYFEDELVLLLIKTDGRM